MGTDSKNWEGVIGLHGTGKINSNSLLLLNICTENNLTITNTLYWQANKYKTTWMHPRSKQWHMINFAIVSRQDIQKLCITRVMRAAECWMDHQLVMTTLRLHFAPPQHKWPKTVHSAFNTARLKHPRCRNQFQEELAKKLT